MNNKPTHQLRGAALILTINGGSSSIKLALFEAGDSLRRILEGGIAAFQALAEKRGIEP
ncbi:MAG: hypothetical protein ABSA52_25300 [Candidatus Binatia bacterium]|jgi:acetate kinase